MFRKSRRLHGAQTSTGTWRDACSESRKTMRRRGVGTRPRFLLVEPKAGDGHACTARGRMCVCFAPPPFGEASAASSPRAAHSPRDLAAAGRPADLGPVSPERWKVSATNRSATGPNRGPPRSDELRLLAYRGGNCESGRGSARLAVGGLAVNPRTAQLISTPTEP